MERILKSFCILMVVFFVAITVGSVTDQDVYAGGGINYTVTVHNPTAYVAREVNVFCWEGDDLKAVGAAVRISPGGSCTWELGDKCPSFIKGRIQINRYMFDMRNTDCFGNDYTSSRLPQSKCCKDISMKICRKAGQDRQGVPLDGDYGFCLK